VSFSFKANSDIAPPWKRRPARQVSSFTIRTRRRRIPRAKNPDRKELDPIADDLAKIYEETLAELQNRGS
jgi:hypothetical protein